MMSILKKTTVQTLMSEPSWDQVKVGKQKNLDKQRSNKPPFKSSTTLKLVENHSD